MLVTWVNQINKSSHLLLGTTQYYYLHSRCFVSVKLTNSLAQKASHIWKQASQDLKVRFSLSSLEHLLPHPLFDLGFYHIQCKSISSGAQYVWPCKNNFHIQVLVTCFLFFNPTHKNWNLGQQVGTGLLIANHLDQSLWWKQWATSGQIIFITLFSRMCTMLLCLSQAATKPCWNCARAKNHFAEPNP